MIRSLTIASAFALSLLGAQPSTSVIALPECGNHCPFVAPSEKSVPQNVSVIALPECGDHCPFIQ